MSDRLTEAVAGFHQAIHQAICRALRSMAPADGRSAYESGYPVAVFEARMVVETEGAQLMQYDYAIEGGAAHLTNPMPAQETGLSPHERGNRAHRHAALGGVGTIPARAGEPPAAASGGSTRGDYPRTSGGTMPARSDRSIRLGLSPHERGNPRRRAVDRVLGGTIPARAGEPRPGVPSLGQAQDYPRTSGGTACPPIFPAKRDGLSPHERGNRR